MSDRAASGRRHRGGAVVSAVLLLLFVAGDLAIGLGLPVLTSTCTDRLCGPGLAVAAGAGGAIVIAVVAWLVGDVLRDRGRGLWLCWVAVGVAALPWVLLLPALAWWTPVG